MHSRQSGPVEFSRPVDISRLGDSESRHDIEATPAERKVLARRLDLLSLDRLSAAVRLRRVRGGTAVRLSGRFTAEVTQRCVVTLEPVSGHIEEEFEVLYADAPLSEEIGFGADAELSGPDEALPEGDLDIGEAVAQQLSLSLDPYPRAPGAALDHGMVGEEGRHETPFARLAVLRKTPPSSGRA